MLIFACTFGPLIVLALLLMIAADLLRGKSLRTADRAPNNPIRFANDPF